MHFRMLTWLCAITVGACSHADNAPQPKPAPVQAAGAARAASVAQPPAVMVLKDIYGVAFKNEDGQSLDGGVFAGYWTGERIPDAGASPVFVALTDETPGPEQETPKAQDTLNLSGAIYQQDASGHWQLKGKQRAFGRFGAKEQPPQVADGVSSVWLKVSGGKSVWAVPTVVPAMGGARFEFYELVGVDVDKGKLTDLGRMRAAESAPVDCKPDAAADSAQACFKWQTRLSLAAGGAGAEWPGIAAVRQGSRYDSAQRRVMPVNERIVYPYDATKGALRIDAK